MSAQITLVDSVFDPKPKAEEPTPSNFIFEEMKKIEELFAKSKTTEEENVQLKEDHEQLKEDHEQLKEENVRLKKDHEQLKDDHARLKKEYEELKVNQINVDWLNEKVREVMFSQICEKLPNGFSNIGFNDIRIVHYNASNRTHMIFSYNNDPNSLRLVVDISLKNAKLIQKKGFTFEESDSETIYTSLPDTCVQIRQYGSGWTFEVISIINKKSYGFYNKALGINEYPFDISPEIPGYI